MFWKNLKKLFQRILLQVISMCFIIQHYVTTNKNQSFTKYLSVFQ